MAFMALAALAAIAFTADLVTLRMKAEQALGTSEGRGLVAEALLEVATATNRYVDFAGRFSLPHPPSWAAYPYKNEGDYDVTLRGPHRMEVCIATRPVKTASLDEVRAVILEKQRRQNLNFAIEQVEILGRPAFRRTAPLRTITIECYDFLSNGRHIHIALSAPRNSFEHLRPVLLEMVRGVHLPDDPGGRAL